MNYLKNTKKSYKIKNYKNKNDTKQQNMRKILRNIREYRYKRENDESSITIV